MPGRQSRQTKPELGSDRLIYNFRSSKSRDAKTLCSWKTSFDGFRSSQIVKESVVWAAHFLSSFSLSLSLFKFYCFVIHPSTRRSTRPDNSQLRIASKYFELHEIRRSRDLGAFILRSIMSGNDMGKARERAGGRAGGQAGWAQT